MERAVTIEDARKNSVTLLKAHGSEAISTS